MSSWLMHLLRIVVRHQPQGIHKVQLMKREQKTCVNMCADLQHMNLSDLFRSDEQVSGRTFTGK